ncbi:MAG: hypothetical protein WD278_15340 [Pirellulales bacterium]
MADVAERKTKADLIRGFLETRPEASTAEIVSEMSGQGVPVSPALVNAVRYDGEHELRRRWEKIEGTYDPEPADTPPEPKPKRGAKAQAIRDTFGALGEKARPSQVIKELAGRGIKVSSSQVIAVRKGLQRTGRAKPPARPERAERVKESVRKAAAPAIDPGEDSIPLEHLIEAKKLVDKLGGFKAAERAIWALALLQ